MRIEIVPYKESWPSDFEILARAIAQQLAGLYTGIHHIGSTSVPGLGAKDVIDIQVTVPHLSEQIIGRLQEIGIVWLSHITGDHRPPGQNDIPDVELSKWIFQATQPRANIHVRIGGYYNQRYPLLCRDYLRANPNAAKAYEVVKKNLSKYFADDANAYYDIKDPVFDIIMAGAELWAGQTGWEPTVSDI